MIPEKVTESFIGGAMAVSVFAVLLMGATANRMSFWPMWLIENTIYITAFTVMTLYKRNRWGWLWVGYSALVALATLTSYVGGHFFHSWDTSQLAGAWFWIAGTILGIGWQIAIRMERFRKIPPLPVQEIVNHHVFYGLPGATSYGAEPVYRAQGFPTVRGADDHAALRPGPSLKAIAAVPTWSQTSHGSLRRRVMAKVGRAVRDSW